MMIILNSETSLKRNRDIFVTVKTFELSVNAQLLFFFFKSVLIYK